jgi:hypothetical protein
MPNLGFQVVVLENAECLIDTLVNVAHVNLLAHHARHRIGRRPERIVLEGARLYG